MKSLEKILAVLIGGALIYGCTESKKNIESKSQKNYAVDNQTSIKTYTENIIEKQSEQPIKNEDFIDVPLYMVDVIDKDLVRINGEDGIDRCIVTGVAEIRGARHSREINLTDSIPEYFCVWKDEGVYIFVDSAYKKQKSCFTPSVWGDTSLVRLVKCKLNGEDLENLYVAAAKINFEKNIYGESAGRIESVKEASELYNKLQSTNKNQDSDENPANLIEYPYNEFISENELKANLAELRNNLSKYYGEYGKYPERLEEVEITRGDWVYNPKNGHVWSKSNPDW